MFFLIESGNQASINKILSAKEGLKYSRDDSFLCSFLNSIVQTIATKV